MAMSACHYSLCFNRKGVYDRGRFVVKLFIFIAFMLVICNANGLSISLEEEDAQLSHKEKDGTVYKPTPGASLPRVIKRTPPRIPKGFPYDEGVVVLEVTISADSSIAHIKVKESVPELDSLAIETVKQWSFMPAYQDDEEAIIGTLLVEVDFSAVGKRLDRGDDLTDSEVLFLRSEIARYLSDKREIIKHLTLKLPIPSYSENYHLYSYSKQMPIIKQNGFILVPDYSSPSHKLQSMFPLFAHKIERYKWQFFTDEYDLPITLVDAYLGTGYLDMNYGHLNLMKNNLFDFESLQLVAGYITDDGHWMGSDDEATMPLTKIGRESRSDLMANIYYPFGDFSLRWNTFIGEQSSPASQFRYHNNPDTLYVNRKQTTHSLLFDNPIVDVGLRYEKTKYSSYEAAPERTILQFNLNRKLKLKEHSLYLQLETMFFEEKGFFSLPFLQPKKEKSFFKKPEQVYTMDYNFDTSLIYLDVELMSGLNYKYNASSEAGYKLAENVGIGLGYIENEQKQIESLLIAENSFPEARYFHQNVDNDIYSKVVLATPQLEESFFPDISLFIGQQRISQQSFQFGDQEVESKELETYYVSSDHTFNLMTGNLNWTLYGFAQYYYKNEDLDYLPSLYIRSVLEAKYLLKHGNIISAGLIHHYAQEYRSFNKIIEDTTILDAFVRISLTDKFDIQADAINLLETEKLFGAPYRAGMHFNLGIRWLFFN